ncbi:MAG: hypothetical protein KAH20_09860 [Methylococcales bacterium]|nr:hypothetical protein [Methylococcales bacterium]
MYQLLRFFFDICLLKKGPQDFPASDWVFRLLILVCAFVDFLILILSSNVFYAVLQSFIEITLILVLAWIILYIANKRSRFQQTAGALLATDALISFMAFPAMALLLNDGGGLVFFVILLLMAWHWIVSGHIFSHALEKPFTFGLGVAFLYILVSMQVMGLLFPGAIVIE